MNTPSHEAIAQRAREIWHNYGSPEGRDTEIWLEAERQLAGTVDLQPAAAQLEVSRTVTESKGASGLAGRESSDSPVPTSGASEPKSEAEPVKATPPKKPARSAKASTKLSAKGR